MRRNENNFRKYPSSAQESQKVLRTFQQQSSTYPTLPATTPGNRRHDADSLSTGYRNVSGLSCRTPPQRDWTAEKESEFDDIMGHVVQKVQTEARGRIGRNVDAIKQDVKIRMQKYNENMNLEVRSL